MPQATRPTVSPPSWALEGLGLEGFGWGPGEGKPGEGKERHSGECGFWTQQAWVQIFIKPWTCAALGTLLSLSAFFPGGNDFSKF